MFSCRQRVKIKSHCDSTSIGLVDDAVWQLQKRSLGSVILSRDWFLYCVDTQCRNRLRFVTWPKGEFLFIYCSASRATLPICAWGSVWRAETALHWRCVAGFGLQSLALWLGLPLKNSERRDNSLTHTHAHIRTCTSSLSYSMCSHSSPAAAPQIRDICW